MEITENNLDEFCHLIETSNEIATRIRREENVFYGSLTELIINTCLAFYQPQ